jgi:hypothetical protein
MPDCDELLRRARENPAGLRFGEICQLAECFGFERKRQHGSHVIYKRPGCFQLMNFQNDQGMAKAFQVRQLVAAIDGILESGSESED